MPWYDTAGHGTALTVSLHFVLHAPYRKPVDRVDRRPPFKGMLPQLWPTPRVRRLQEIYIMAVVREVTPNVNTTSYEGCTTIGL